tara:strand:- start:46211 stop:47272 length:1062 start_codon:yes stop_codon:yes gene_type:complete
MKNLKYKKWLDNIYRYSDNNNSRYSSIRLDKNEKNDDFDKFFLNTVIKNFTSTHVTAYPNFKDLYNLLKKNLKIKKDNILLTAGSDAAIKSCFEIFVNPKDEVVYLDPTFAMVDIYAKIYNAKSVKIKYNKNLSINVEKFLSKINKKTSLVIIANPNSPTGTILNMNDMIMIIDYCNKKNTPILIDEAYYGYTDKTLIKHFSKFNNLIISRTFSKMFGIAGLRVGYLVSNKKIINILKKIRPMYEINSLGAFISSQLLQNQKIVKNNLKNQLIGKNFLVKELKKLKYEYIETHANFIHINLNKNYNFIIKKLSKKKILVNTSMKIKGFENFIRITIGPKNLMEEVIKVFKDVN